MTADDKSKTYGDDNPTLTATVTGTVNGDTLNYTLATTAVKFSNVGSYPITVTPGLNPNYNVSKTDGTLSIDQKAASVTADPKSKTYGDDNPTLTATVTGTVNGDTLNYSLATTALKFSNVGSYPITVTPGQQPELQRDADGRHADDQPEAGDGDRRRQVEDLRGRQPGADGDGDRDGQRRHAQLLAGDDGGEVLERRQLPDHGHAGHEPELHGDADRRHADDHQKPATVTADAQVEDLRRRQPDADGDGDGTVNGDTLNYSLATTALKFSNVGGYPITVTWACNPNYTVTPTDSTLTIDQKAASVTADAQVEDLRGRQPDADRDGDRHGQRRHAQLLAGDDGAASSRTSVTTRSRSRLGTNPNYKVSRPTAR